MGFKCENFSTNTFTIRKGTNVFAHGPMNYIYCVRHRRSPWALTTDVYALCYDERLVVTNILSRKRRSTLGDL